METEIVRFAQTNAGRIRLAGLFFLAISTLTRLSCLTFAAETNCWMWMIFVFECLWSYQSFAVVLPSKPGKTSERLHLTGNRALPSVDILLPCCGEPLDIILDTIRAVCVLDYPQSAFRVLVLDDGNSLELRQAVEELNHSWPNLLYHNRGTKPSQKVFAKAGNLNYALYEVQGKMSEPPEFIVGFDSDFLPDPSFLRATLPHLLEDHSVGLVGAIQDFYNLPPRDPLSQGLEFFREFIFPRMNELGSSIASGSGFVMRRQLAVEVGGFPTFTEAEDIALSIMVTAYGKRVLALEEMLQFGRVPTSLEGHVRQRRRWSTSLTQFIATLWAPIPKDSVLYALRFRMALFGIMYLFPAFSQTVGCAIITPALMSGQPLVPSFLLRLQMVLSLVTFGLVWLYEWFKAAGTGFRVSTFTHLQDLWRCADRLCTHIQFDLFGSQGGRSVVTGSAQNPWNNSSKVSHRIAQLKSDLWESGIGFNVLFVLGTVAGMVGSLVISSESASWQMHAITTWLCPPVVLMCYIINFCHIAPVVCVIWPPRYPPREAVLDTHPRDARAVFPSEAVQQNNVRPRLAPLGYRDHLLLVPAYLILMAMFYFLYL